MTAQVRPNYIITKTSSYSWLIALRDILLTVIVWLIYFFYMRDFFYFIGDLVNWSLTGFNRDRLFTEFSILGTIVSYLEIMFIFSFIFISWSLYNKARYGKLSRRRFPSPVETEEIARAFHVETKDTALWKKAKIMIAHHDERGRITEVIIQK